MSLVTLLLLAVALGTDAFSICIGIGMAGVRKKQILVITFTILIFHILMPLIGWYIGEVFGRLLGRAAAVVGALILVYLGGKMLWSTWRGGAEEESGVLNTGILGLFILAASVSMDALSVGFTLGTRSVNLIQVAGTIGLVAGIMTFAGLVFGRFIGQWVGSRAELLGGVILIGIGTKLFWG